MRTEAEIRKEIQTIMAEIEIQLQKDNHSDKISILFQTLITLYWVLQEPFPKQGKFNPGR